jgi:rfaE bifunctional protein nucleotidyltransferase chain/domain
MATAEKVLNRYQFVKFIKACKGKGKSVVFTNGCFDLVHYGHISYLEKAKELGDILVIGVNTDESVRKLKGPHRPIVKEYDRARLLAAFGFVDAITLFGDETPKELIEECLPSVLVKGSDYEIADIVGAEAVIKGGGLVKTLDFISGYSSSSIIDSIKKGF